MTKVIWREWYSPPAVEEMTRLGTLPLETADVTLAPRGKSSGADVARAIVELVHADDVTAFRDGGKIVIVEPSELAGTYRVDVDYEPSFYAYLVDDDQ